MTRAKLPSSGGWLGHPRDPSSSSQQASIPGQPHLRRGRLNGAFLPAGIYKRSPSATYRVEQSTSYVFSRKDWSRPLLQLPALKTATSAARFCPVLFRRSGVPGGAVVDLPYRMVFAVAAQDSVLVYETESFRCLAAVGGLHLAIITDLAWSPDGRVLAASSRDGFCSLIAFEEGELGQPLLEDQLPVQVAQLLPDSAAFRARHAPAASSPDLSKIRAQELTSDLPATAAAPGASAGVAVAGPATAAAVAPQPAPVRAEGRKRVAPTPVVSAPPPPSAADACENGAQRPASGGDESSPSAKKARADPQEGETAGGPAKGVSSMLKNALAGVFGVRPKK